MIALTLKFVSEDELLDWGWRLPLLASVVLVIFGLWLRIGVTETPQFRELAQRGAKTRAPLSEVLRNHWRGLITGGGARIGPDVQYSLVAVFTLTTSPPFSGCRARSR